MASSHDRSATDFVVESAFETRTLTTTIVVHGDIDAPEAKYLAEAARRALSDSRSLVIRLDAVTFFASAAVGAIEQILDEADRADCSLNVSGFHPVALRVLDLLGVDDARLDRRIGDDEPLSDAVFEAVLGRALLHSREAVCITTYDADDPRIVFVNEAFTSLTGFNSAQILGLDPKFLQGELTDRAVVDSLVAAIRNDRDFHGETVNYRLDGSPFWMNWKIVPMKVGATSYYVSLQRDGSRMRQAGRYEVAHRNLNKGLSRSTTATEVLDVLCDAVEVLVDDPDARLDAVVWSGDSVRWQSSGADERVPRRVADTTSELIDSKSAVLHVPFALREPLAGQLSISNLHPDWLGLLDREHIGALADAAGRALTVDHLANGDS